MAIATSQRGNQSEHDLFSLEDERDNLVHTTGEACQILATVCIRRPLLRLRDLFRVAESMEPPRQCSRANDMRTDPALDLACTCTFALDRGI